MAPPLNSSHISNEVPELFPRIDEAARTILVQMGQAKALAKKEGLPQFTNPPRELVLIEKGWLSVSIDGAVVSLLKPGEVFLGPVCSSQTQLRAAITLTAVSNAEVILIPRAFLSSIGHEFPGLLLDIYYQSCARLTHIYFDRFLRQHAPLEERLAAFLWAVGLPTAGNDRILPPIGQAIVASCLGTGREEISRKRQLLIQKNIVRKLEDGTWVVCACVGLTQQKPECLLTKPPLAR